MTKPKKPHSIFPSAADDELLAQHSHKICPSYALAYADKSFLLRDELRSVRLQLEWLKPDIIQQELGIESTVVFFGSARIPEPEVAEQRLQKAKQQLNEQPKCHEAAQKFKTAQAILANSLFYNEARKLSSRITKLSMEHENKQYVIVSGGGPGIMEAANRGAHDAGGKSIGLNIVLPFEQNPNPYITPELTFQFHYFAIRKMHFLKRACALVAFPGGFGTLDELLDALTLMQTKKIAPMPIILMGKGYWNQVINFKFLAEQGTIQYKDLELFFTVDTEQEAWEILNEYWQSDDRPLI